MTSIKYRETLRHAFDSGTSISNALSDLELQLIGDSCRDSLLCDNNSVNYDRLTQSVAQISQ